MRRTFWVGLATSLKVRRDAGSLAHLGEFSGLSLLRERRPDPACRLPGRVRRGGELDSASMGAPLGSVVFVNQGLDGHRVLIVWPMKGRDTKRGPRKGPSSLHSRLSQPVLAIRTSAASPGRSTCVCTV